MSFADLKELRLLEGPLSPEDVSRYLYEQFALLRLHLGDIPGASGTFTTADAKTVTVTDGIITSIV